MVAGNLSACLIHYESSCLDTHCIYKRIASVKTFISYPKAFQGKRCQFPGLTS
jgi:hypothetical protein